MRDYTKSTRLTDGAKVKIQKIHNLYPELFTMHKHQRNKVIKRALYLNVQAGLCKPYSYFKDIIDGWEAAEVLKK